MTDKMIDASIVGICFVQGLMDKVLWRLEEKQHLRWHEKQTRGQVD